MKKGIFLCIIICLSFSAIGVAAVSLCNAKDIVYNAADTAWDVDTVEDALNDLYQGNGSISKTCELLKNYTYTFEYTGDVQEFLPICDGEYEIELWGASGGKGFFNSQSNAGKGAYTRGTVYLTAGEKLYVYVGGEGESAQNSSTSQKGGYNGGGLGAKSSDNDDAAGGGGGATDVRLVGGEWNNFESLKSRIMVAAGGGGGHAVTVERTSEGLNAGGLKVYGFIYIYGDYKVAPYVNQTSGYAFGYGRDGESIIHAGAGGGGGYFGGYTTTNFRNSYSGQASGGSSYISGHDGAMSLSSDSTEEQMIFIGKNHSSGKYFINTYMVDGGGYEWTTERKEYVGTPSYNGTENTAGNTGNGYARIHYVSLTSSQPRDETCQVGETYEYGFKSREQFFTVPCDGKYQIELWGASGGDDYFLGQYNADYGLGGYTSGNIILTKNRMLHIYTGQKGNHAINRPAGTLSGQSFNGGGSGIAAPDLDDGGGSGGGATDVRLVGGKWDNFDSLKSRIMVAGGGGGGATIAAGFSAHSSGSGGGLTGVGKTWYYLNTQYDERYNATQTSGYKFGIGENGYSKTSLIGHPNGGAGGGGGYYGGLSDETYVGGAGGGSSFISGHAGCNAILESSTENDIKPSGKAVHYSGLSFTETKMIDGEGYEWSTVRGDKIGMPSPNGLETIDGNDDNGYVRITYLGQ